MQEVLDKLVDSRIFNLLEIININYHDKFKKCDIEKELIYIKQHINWKVQKSITDDNDNETKISLDTKKIIQLKIKKGVKKGVKKDMNKDMNKVKTNTNINQNVNQCSGRTWSNYIYNTKTNKQLDDIEDKFKVDDFNDLDIKDFNSKYKLGLRCCRNKVDKSKYCNLHTKHLIHGNYLELPDKELCYHFMKDGKYL
jgi:hypothetical protein